MLTIHTLPGQKFSKTKKQWKICYHDKDNLLLHASFQILVDFMQKENPKSMDWNSSRETKRAWREITRLYAWYTEERPQRPDIWEVFYRKFEDEDWDSIPLELKVCVAKKQGELDREWYKEDTQNLIALMRVRKHLWT